MTYRVILQPRTERDIWAAARYVIGGRLDQYARQVW